jgi:mono/diheme cytochrome c family protein
VRAPSALALAASFVVAGSACEGVLPAPDLERMLVQRSVRAYEAAPGGGAAMRTPPAGTVSRARPLGRPALEEGVVDGRFVERVQVPVDLALLDRGRDRFDAFCATCHGVRGDGDSPVARAMTLRKPPSLLSPPVATYPPGRIFAATTAGYGLMPSYASVLPTRDRWAVVAYLRALVLSQAVPLDDLPAELRAAALEALP